MEEPSIILINKPKGITSAKVVELIRNRFNKKTGHTGTLDPLATGLLIVLLGNKTKESSKFSGLDKVYEVEAILGIKTDTYDLGGKALQQNKKKIFRREFKKILSEFKGEIFQEPPAFSAKKVRGKEAYKLARAGKKFKLNPQKVKIYYLKLLNYNYPYFKMRIKVSSGFYVRSLVDDIGKKLGVGAVVKEIKRLQIGNYCLKQAKNLEEFLD